MSNFTPQQRQLIISALTAPDSLTFSDVAEDTSRADAKRALENAPDFIFNTRRKVSDYPAEQIFKLDPYGNFAPIPGRPALNYGTPPAPMPMPPINEFRCPMPGSRGCLSDIPRNDVTIVSSLTVGGRVASIDLSGVRGMYLCRLEGLFSFEINPEADPTPTPFEVQAALQELMFFATWSLNFRGEKVPGFTDRPISEISPEMGCCDSVSVCVDCIVPQDGAMSLEWVIPEVSTWITNEKLVVRSHFSGCGCSCSTSQSCGCGCGSGGRRYDVPQTYNPQAFEGGGSTNNGTF